METPHVAASAGKPAEEGDGVKYFDEEDSPWPRGNDREPCPRCDPGGAALLAGKVRNGGVCILDYGTGGRPDTLICLDCGCEFTRGGGPVHPYGVDDEHIDLLWRAS